MKAFTLEYGNVRARIYFYDDASPEECIVSNWGKVMMVERDLHIFEDTGSREDSIVVSYN